MISLNFRKKALRQRKESYNRLVKYPEKSRTGSAKTMTKKQRKKKIKHRGFRIFVGAQVFLLLLLALGAGYYFFGGYAKKISDLQAEAVHIARMSKEEDFRSAETSVVYASDGSWISVLKGEKDSYYLTAEEIPFNVKAAIVSIEDKKFYRHHGVDYKAILRAIIAMIRNGEATQGGSTITQQLARNIYLSQEKTWERKMEEIFLAQELEKKYSKSQILEFYLNNIYFANGYYGIEAASKGYFNLETKQLSLSQMAFLLAIPNSPTYYDPMTNMGHTIQRRNRILKNMLEDEVISKRSYDTALTETIILDRPVYSKNVYVETYAYYCATRALMEWHGFVFRYDYNMSEEERQVYEEAYGEMYSQCQRELYTGGYRIYTTLNLKIQEQLQESIDEELSSFTEQNEEGVFCMQGAGVCIDNSNGYVVAIVGGRSQEFEGYTLNRAYQSFRQPGSAIKPLIVYTPALEEGYLPDSLVMDEKIEDGPENASGGYLGEITLREAVAKSQNTVAWNLLKEITPEKGLNYLNELEFTHVRKSDLREASALGGFTKGASAVEMTAGYAALENDGKYREATCIQRITDADGNLVYQGNREGVAVYELTASRMMTEMLEAVMTEGTGTRLQLTNMPSAGKTGTTNDNKDGWFVGYTRYYTAGIWVGYDMPQAMHGLAGNTYPGWIWQDFMDKIHEGKTPLDFLPYLDYTNGYQGTDMEAYEAMMRQRQEELEQEDAKTLEENSPEAEQEQEDGADAGIEERPVEESPVEEAPVEEENRND